MTRAQKGPRRGRFMVIRRDCVKEQNLPECATAGPRKRVMPRAALRRGMVSADAAEMPPPWGDPPVHGLRKRRRLKGGKHEHVYPYRDGRRGGRFIDGPCGTGLGPGRSEPGR